MLATIPEIVLSQTPDRLVMFVPGLNANRARQAGNLAAYEARTKMPKATGESARRLQPLYGKNYFGVRWMDCLVPGTRVLRGDWTWVPVEKLQVGDDLIAFDEEVVPTESGHRGRGRRYRTAQVVQALQAVRECVEVEFDDGTAITSTKSHPWLALRPRNSNARQWISAEDLEPGDRLGVYLEPWEDAASFDEGWLAGMFDGEGSVIHQKGPCSNHLVMAQNSGPVLDRVLGILDRLGYSFRVTSKRKGTCQQVMIRGGFAEQARFLGSLRPTRLLSRMRHEGLYMRALRERTVVAVREVKSQPVVLMETTTSTYLAEGMGSHNSYVYFQEKGIKGFTMRNLAGKTIPMWIKDPTGQVRAKNPKAQVRTRTDGVIEVKIFRKAARIGARIQKVRTDPVTGIKRIVEDKPASYPGAPGRIATREMGSPLLTPGKVAGAVGSGNIGVRWYHPGIAPRLFLNNGMAVAAQKIGVIPIRVYVAEANWRSLVHGAEYGG